MDKKFGRNVAIAGGVLLVLLVVFALTQLRSGTRQSPEPEVSNPNKIESYQNGELPPAFPKELILESGVKLTNSFTATSPDGKVQSTIGFDSAKSVETNFELYQNYLARNDWKLVQTANDTADHKAILANNSEGYLTINISKGAVSGSVIMISFLTIK